MLELARDIAAQGWAILPVKPMDDEDDRAPYLTAWEQRATTDADTLSGWWGRWPSAIPAIHVGFSGLVVFDLEGTNKAHNGCTPEQNAAALGLDKHPTLTVRTPSGGLHFYYEGQLEHKRKLYVDDLFVGDCQANNAYVIPAGVPGYAVERGGAVKALPDALLDVGRKATTGRAEPRDDVGAGERNDYLTSIGGGLRRFMRSEQQLFDALMVENKAACKPPLDEDEVWQVVKSLGRYEADGLDKFKKRERTEQKPASTKPQPISRTRALTDLGNARRFRDRWGHSHRFVPKWGKWIVWDGMCWSPDDDGQAERNMVETLVTCADVERALLDDCDIRGCRKLWHPDCLRVELSDWLKRSQSLQHIENALKLASTGPGMHVTPDDLDGRKDLLNCPNGMVDLRSGKLLEHDPEALCTLVTKVDYVPDARSERFEDFLVEVFPDSIDTGSIVAQGEVYEDNGAMREYVQRAFGYTLLGAPEREQTLFMHYGQSASGKSTLIEALSAALGDYQQPADVEAVLARKRGQHPHDLAQLRGARLVDTSELDIGERLSESVVKRVTSGERINARFMRQNIFTYVPTWVLHVTTNHGFTLGAGGPSMRRRISIIPWTVTFVGKNEDKKLRETLKGEGEALLAWAVAGAVEYHQRGYDLARPQVAQDVGRELFRDADPIAAFVNEAVDITGDDSHYATGEALYEAFTKWWIASGRKGDVDYNKNAFGMALSRIPGMPKSADKRIGANIMKARKGIRIRGEYS